MIQGLQPGGQLTTTNDVENYPGYPNGVDGTKMMEDFKFQAERFDTDTRWGMVSKVDFSKRPFKVEIDEKNLAEIMANSDIAIGASGTTTWERCCLGLPTIQIIAAYNQMAIANHLDKINAIKPKLGRVATLARTL